MRVHPVADGGNALPSGVTPRVDALLRLGQIALEIGSAHEQGCAIELSVLYVTRAQFDRYEGRVGFHEDEQGRTWRKTFDLEASRFDLATDTWYPGVMVWLATKEPPLTPRQVRDAEKLAEAGSYLADLRDTDGEVA